MDVKQYLIDVQSIAIDDAAAKLYAPMVATINAQIRDAAHARVAFEDEPAHFTRFLRDENRSDSPSASGAPARNGDA